MLALAQGCAFILGDMSLDAFARLEEKLDSFIASESYELSHLKLARTALQEEVRKLTQEIRRLHISLGVLTDVLAETKLLDFDVIGPRLESAIARAEASVHGRETEGASPLGGVSSSPDPSDSPYRSGASAKLYSPVETVFCATCAGRTLKRATFVTVAGTICEACHRATRDPTEA